MSKGLKALVIHGCKFIGDKGDIFSNKDINTWEL
jgi:hypothetical protein